MAPGHTTSPLDGIARSEELYQSAPGPTDGQDLEFLVLFRRPSPATHVPTQEQWADLDVRWGAFLGGLGARGALRAVHQTTYEGVVVTASGSTPVDLGVDTVLGWAVVAAPSLEAAAALVADAPPISAWAGSAEVRPLQPAPARA